MKKIKQLVLTNLPIKLISLVSGYLVWSLISGSHVICITQEVPVCIYNCEPYQSINAPETIMVTLQAQRNTLYSLDAQELAIHLDASTLHKGHNQLLVDRSTLFLPEGVNVVHYSPSNAVIQLTEKN
jgi:YbbR domain-containing protein